MLGTIIGDIVGTRYKGTPAKTKPALRPGGRFTGITIQTIAVAEWITEAFRKPVYTAKQPDFDPERLAGTFTKWRDSYPDKPCDGNDDGAALRASPAGFIADDGVMAPALAGMTASITREDGESIRRAEAVAYCIYRCRCAKGLPKEDRKRFLENLPADVKSRFGYGIEPLDSLRSQWAYPGTGRTAIPAALSCLVASSGFKDALRRAVAIGGDPDRLAAITGGMAEALWGIPPWWKWKTMMTLPRDIRLILKAFYRYSPSPGRQ